MTARCPLCNRDDVRMAPSTERFVPHDRGFRGRARREVWRMDPCPAGGHTIAEAEAIAKESR